MGAGYGFIKALIKNQVPFSSVMERGIDEKFFKDKELQAFVFVADYYREYQSYPSYRLVEIEIEQEVIENAPDGDINYWYDVLINCRQRDILKQLASEASMLYSSDVLDTSFDSIYKHMTELQYLKQESKVTDLALLEKQVLEEHDKYQQFDREAFVPLGFPYFDDICGGARKGDMIVVAGETGVGKSNLMLFMAKQMYEAYDKSILMVSTEMPAQQVARRILAMQSGVNSNQLKLGQLSYFGRERIANIVAQNTEISNKFFKVIDGGIYSTVEDLPIMVADYRPSIVCIDGAYLLKTKGRQNATWERVMAVMETIKQIALKYNVAVVITHQYNKEDPNSLKGLGGTIAVSQLASMVFSFEYVNKTDRESKNPIQRRFLSLLKGRDGESGKITVEYNMQNSSIYQVDVVSGAYSYLEDDQIGGDGETVDDGGVQLAVL